MRVSKPLEGRASSAIAICAALALHGGLWLWTLRIGRVVAAPMRRVVEFSLDAVHVEPPAATPPPPAQEPLPKARAASRARALSGKPPPTAAPLQTQAAAPVAAEAEPSGAVDLTGDTFVIGSAHGSGAGVASASGSEGGAARDRAGSPRAAVDSSSTVSLASQAWSCPWPIEADAERIDEQTVVIRVVVDALGNAQSATVISDPGHGFGGAAVSCAMRTHFSAAHDRAGRPVRAESPPIRVRFTR